METDSESLTSQALPTESAKAPPRLSDPERWVELHGDYLFSYAMTRLRDLTKAEDAVQETFLAALKGGKAFAGRSAEKSWLVGILKNKICDHYRRASRETPFTDLEFYSDEESGRFVCTNQGSVAHIPIFRSTSATASEPPGHENIRTCASDPCSFSTQPGKTPRPRAMDLITWRIQHSSTTLGVNPMKSKTLAHEWFEEVWNKSQIDAIDRLIRCRRQDRRQV